MADSSNGTPGSSVSVATPGRELDEFQNPGLPPHRPRLADRDPRAEKRAERQVALLFGISALGTVLFFVGYFFIPLNETIERLRLQNLMLGLGTAFAMLGIGVGIVHWAKTLMPDHEVTESRHDIRPDPPPRAHLKQRWDDHHRQRDRHHARGVHRGDPLDPALGRGA